MKDYEQIAIEKKKNGNNCSTSIYKTFEEDLKLNGQIPVPRSIEEKCGALLATEQILKEIKKEEYIEEYETLFQQEFGYLTCKELMKENRRCNDYVGLSVKYIKNIIENR